MKCVCVVWVCVFVRVWELVHVSAFFRPVAALKFVAPKVCLVVCLHVEGEQEVVCFIY